MADAKIEQLLEALSKYVPIQERSLQASPTKSVEASKKAPEVFISYCWMNSKKSYEAKEIKQCVGKFA